MNYLRKIRNRYIVKIELVSALDNGSFLISPANGFTDDDIPVEYNGIYFTISSISLVEESKESTSGTSYPLQLTFSFPTFPGVGSFKKRFAKLSEIRITLNTSEVIRINKNDIALNKPISALFNNNLKTTQFEATISRIQPLDLDD